MSSERLSSFIAERLPGGLCYSDAAQLCLHLYCVAADIPVQLRDQTERQHLAAAFAELAQIGWIKDQDSPLRVEYGAHFHRTTDLGHWIEVIASIYKKGDIVDSERGKELALRLCHAQSNNGKSVA